MSQMTQAVIRPDGTTESQGRDIVRKFVAEVTGSVILDWRPEEFKRRFETSSRKQVETMLADLEEVRGALNGVITTLTRIRDTKPTTPKEVPAIVTKPDPAPSVAPSDSKMPPLKPESLRRTNAPDPETKPKVRPDLPPLHPRPSPGRPIRYKTTFRNSGSQKGLAPKVAAAPSIAGGGKERVVIVYDDSVLHDVWKGLTRLKYVEAWDKRKLGFQQKGSPKPDFLPSREEALDPNFEW